MKFPLGRNVEQLIRQQYALGPLTPVTLDDAGESVTIQIAGKYSKRRLSPTAKEFLVVGYAFWSAGEELLLPETK
jgi:hypothetical protein